jgi:hypothetical protein
MATNKNQHFVPRCYLRPFTLDSANKEINLFNIDRLKFIEHARVKNQCSGDYFYGKDLAIEKALKFVEDAYSDAIRDILKPGYKLIDSHRNFLLRFWLLQYMRTEAASRRSVELNGEIVDTVDIKDSGFRFSIRKAVQSAMQIFIEQINVVDDLKICLLRNRASIPFVTSDDPAVVTNFWYFLDNRTKGRSFGLNAAGNLLLLPLSPRILCLGYDGDVYNIPHENGWVDLRHDKDVEALNQHQFLNCWANIFVHDSAYSQDVHDAFCKVKLLRPNARHIINYAVPDRHELDFMRYRVIDSSHIANQHRLLIHVQTVHPRPSAWPRQIRWKLRGFIFTNGTALGYVRQAHAKLYDYKGFRKELARKSK